MTTAIALETARENWDWDWHWACFFLLVAFSINALLFLLQGEGMTLAYSLKDLTFSYQSRPVLEIDRLEIPAGVEIVALVGPNRPA